MESSTRLVILTTAYNCEKYIIKCLESIRSQNYTNFVCYILDDICTDSTMDLVKEFKDKTKDHRFIVCSNTKKMRQPGNYDQIIRNETLVNNEDIIVEVDGDDWLPDNGVFDRVISYYTIPGIWMTYGQFKYHTGQSGLTSPVYFKKLRQARFTASHLRTWKPQLWRRIKQEDLMVDGEYPEASGDVFFMMPMLEMCGPNHALFVNDINYVYNFENPIGDSKGERLQKTIHFAEVGRKKSPYPRIESL